jgi:integrase
MPFRSEQITALLEACDEITNNYTASADRARPRARALMLLLLYSGLRISDAMRLKRTQLKPDGRLLVRVMKTDKSLYVRLHADCVDALKALPVESEYFLWSGIGKLSSAVGSARRSVAMIGKLARVKDVLPIVSVIRSPSSCW